jgi:hypothetical protein
VLQHLPETSLAHGYLREFMRVARPDGLVAVEVPDRVTLAYRVFARRRPFRALRALGVSPEFLHRRLRLHPIQMIGIPADDVRRTIEAAGGAILHVDRDLSDGPMYFAAKRFA